MFYSLTDIFNVSKHSPALLENVCLRVPNRNVIGFRLFNVDSKRRNGPSSRWASAANTIDGDTDIFNGRSFSVNYWLASDISSR